ncbi:MAG: lipid II flippase MurJ, partial [Rhodoferax sp.]|nr:lipid II flippase MurJ [Rhodoferax sp.]
MGYGAGLIGLIAIKVLAPGFYATQDIRTPVRIAIMVLVFTQLMNIVLVPLFAHAGLTLA